MTSSSDVRLPDLLTYLERAGWTLLDQDERTAMWEPTRAGLRDSDASRVRLVLPVQDSVTDWTESVDRALRALSFVEQRATREIVDDIAFGGADTISVRLTPDAPEGEAPLGVAHAVIEALRNYVVGAASSLDVAGLVLPTRRPARAEAYARDARLSTASGSFVVNLAMPLGTPDQPRATSPDDVPLVVVPNLPYGRRVTNRMVTVARTATALAKSVGNGDDRLEAFARPDRSTANATELAALAALGCDAEDERRRYQVRFGWSPLAPVPQQRPVDVAPIVVTPSEQQVLEDAADFLRTKQPRNNVTVSGLVLRLTRDGNLGPGDISVHGHDDDSGAVRRFRISLAEDDYNRAIRAHEQGLMVLAVGDIELRGNQRYLRNLSAFDLVETLTPDE